MRASAPRFAAESRNFLMRSREEYSLKTDALRHLADALSEGIPRADTFGADAGTRPEPLVRDVPKNFSDSRAPVTSFDHLVGRSAVLGNAARAGVPGPE